MPAAAVADSAEDYCYGKSESAIYQAEPGEAPDAKYTAETPAEMAPDEPACEPAAPEAEEACESGVDCDYPILEPWEIELEGRAYPSGTAIDWALLTTYNGKETVEIRYVSDVAALCEILMDSAEFEASELPHDPIALLELQCGSQYYMLKLYTLSESLIAQTSEGCYIAAGTLEEFLSIK